MGEQRAPEPSPEERKAASRRACIIALVGLSTLVAFFGAFACLGANLERIQAVTVDLPTPPVIPFVAAFTVLSIIFLFGPILVVAYLLRQRRKAEPEEARVPIPADDPVARSKRKARLLVAAGLAVWVVGALVSIGVVPGLAGSLLFRLEGTVDAGTGYAVAFLVCLVVVFPIGVSLVASGVVRLQALQSGKLGTGGITTFLCPACHAELGGEEYRHAMRHGYAVCPKCSTRVTGFEFYDK
jgi:hypothetical protein